jgi:hypothetical protein
MNGIFWCSAVLLPMGSHANHETAPRPALVRKNFGNSNTLTDVKVLTPVDRFAPEFWLLGGSSGTFAQPADTAIAGAARNPNFAIAGLVDNSAGHQGTTACLALLLMHEESILGSVPVSDDL